MSEINISTPLEKSVISKLTAGDTVKLSGIIYTARDAAHKRLIDLIKTGSPLPVRLKDSVLYYTGPTPPRPGSIIGSAGPTTSCRMDSYTPLLIQKTGLSGMIGKGPRSSEVIKAIVKHKCVYFAAVGGAAALISNSVTKMETVCYEDLGPEAIYKLEVMDMPLFVAVDSRGGNLFEEGPVEFRSFNNPV